MTFFLRGLKLLVNAATLLQLRWWWIHKFGPILIMVQ